MLSEHPETLLDTPKHRRIFIVHCVYESLGKLHSTMTTTCFYTCGSYIVPVVREMQTRKNRLCLLKYFLLIVFVIIKYYFDILNNYVMTKQYIPFV